MTAPISIYEFNQRLSNTIATTPDVHNVWVVGETSDVRLSGGHCYLELVEKADDGTNRSRIRANIWANTFNALSRRFQAETGCAFTSGLKVLVCVSASYHPTYGMSVIITNIDSSYTAGDAVRRRNEIIKRLTQEGIINLNRSLHWPFVTNRIAVVSAQNAAGYGDFIKHLFENRGSLRFSLELFTAVMQGERTVPTVLEALRKIENRRHEFDTVVIIRGGGATSDLAAFDDYNLAAAIARFPLPVIIGIGHERDITVLDSVAALRVKTPTAAAEVLIDRITKVLDSLARCAERIYRLTTERIASNREFLARAEASLPGMATQCLIKTAATLDRYAMSLDSSVCRALEKATERLNRNEQLLKVLSPQAVLARGFSLTTLADGTVVRHPSQVPPGTVITTQLAEGSIVSETK